MYLDSEELSDIRMAKLSDLKEFVKQEIWSELPSFMRMALEKVTFRQRLRDDLLRIEVQFRIGTAVVRKAASMRTEREERTKRTIQDLLESLVYEWNQRRYEDEQYHNFEIDVTS